MGMGWKPGNGAHANMSGAQYTKNGLSIPAEWLKKMGDDINVSRAGAVVIIESKQRLAARKQLGKVVRDLHRDAREVGRLEDKKVSVLVDEVRQARAGHH
jgi:hypothetical protein